jgi:SAM-dependent methyltransferase
VRTPVRHPPVPIYAEFETHRVMIRDRVRTAAFKSALEAVVKPGNVVLDVGAGTGILSLFAARAGAAKVYAVEQTSIARVAEELAAVNGVADTVEVIEQDIFDVELPAKVDVLVSEWLGGFGIDEGMLGPVLVARDRWLEPGGVLVPGTVVAWGALVHDAYLADTVDFLSGEPYGLDLEPLLTRTVNEMFYSGAVRHLTENDLRSDPVPLWTTDTARISVDDAEAPHAAEAVLPVRASGVANALAVWFSAELAPGITLSVGPGDPPTHWGMTTAPLDQPVELRAGLDVRVRFRTETARVGTWSSWAVQIGASSWETHDERSMWTVLED